MAEALLSAHVVVASLTAMGATNTVAAMLPAASGARCAESAATACAVLTGAIRDRGPCHWAQMLVGALAEAALACAADSAGAPAGAASGPRTQSCAADAADLGAQLPPSESLVCERDVLCQMACA